MSLVDSGVSIDDAIHVSQTPAWPRRPSVSRSPILLGNSVFPFRDDFVSQFGRLQHLRVLSETHNPPLDFLGPIDRELGNQATVSLFRQLLTRVPG